MAAKKGRKVGHLSEKELNKKYPSAINAQDLYQSFNSSLRIPTRQIWFNFQTGGGIPYGKIVELYGLESSGKSLLAKELAYGTQYLGGVVLWADAESSFNPAWAAKVGLDLSRIEVYPENDVEGISDWIADMAHKWRAVLGNNEPILFVLDSLGGLDCKENIGASQTDKKAEMGNRAKAIYQMYRLRASMFARLGITMIAINQLRDKVGATMYENPETTPGGKSTKFYASIRISLRPGKHIKGLWNEETGEFMELSRDGSAKKLRRVGNKVYCKIVKNKTAAPCYSIESQVHFQPDMLGYIGFSRYHGMEEILLSESLLWRKGTRYFYTVDGEDIQLCNGSKNIVDTISADKTHRRALIKLLRVNTLSKTKKKLSKIEENLYPI